MNINIEMEDVSSVESRRLDLNSNIAKLRKSLQYWLTWAAEYEGMKEEIVSVRPNCTASKLVGLEK